MSKKNDWRQYVGQCGPGPDPAGSPQCAPDETPIKPKPRVIGVVNTERLYVRKTPEMNNTNSLGFIEKDVQVLIDTDLSTEDFYKISTKAGDDGYCMKKYIHLRTVIPNG